jgi:hypothetical protein
MFKKLVLLPIKFYKKYLSPGNYGIKICIFEPSCSRYTMEAIEKHGVFKGLFLGSYRIMRCNPFSKGGFDPVPEN